MTCDQEVISPRCKYPLISNNDTSSNLNDIHRTPPTALAVETHYEAMMGMFGATGHFVRTIPELQKAVKEALVLTDRPTIINVIISPQADRKPQDFQWLTESKL